MNTKIFKIDPGNIDKQAIAECAGILRGGGTVVFPTETVYGLGANALDSDAVKKIFVAKGRPGDNPLIMHIVNPDDITKYARCFDSSSRKLAKVFWPGPLSIILKRKPLVPDETTGGLDTVAFRIPANPIARELIRLSGVPIAAPSANISGKPSPTDGSHVIDDMMGKVDAIIDAGKCRVGLESTVIDMLSDPPAVLRPGGIPFGKIKMIIPDVVKEYSVSLEEAPRSPGMKYRHYSPEASLEIIKGSRKAVVAKINSLIKGNPAAGVLCSYETMNEYDTTNRICIGSQADSDEIAANIFESLRMFDKLDVDVIYSEYFGEGHMGDAIMNRLLKAAGNKVIDTDEEQ